MIQLDNFYNDGFGWMCRPCEKDLPAEAGDRSRPPRLMLEGEAESKDPTMSCGALAKWADPGQTTLVCPCCGITELVDRH